MTFNKGPPENTHTYTLQSLYSITISSKQKLYFSTPLNLWPYFIISIAKLVKLRARIIQPQLKRIQHTLRWYEIAHIQLAKLIQFLYRNLNFV